MSDLTEAFKGYAFQSLIVDEAATVSEHAMDAIRYAAETLSTEDMIRRQFLSFMNDYHPTEVYMPKVKFMHPDEVRYEIERALDLAHGSDSLRAKEIKAVLAKWHDRIVNKDPEPERPSAASRQRPNVNDQWNGKQIQSMDDGHLVNAVAYVEKNPDMLGNNFIMARYRAMLETLYARGLRKREEDI